MIQIGVVAAAVLEVPTRVAAAAAAVVMVVTVMVAT